jgi:hypothetical protein
MPNLFWAKLALLLAGGMESDWLHEGKAATYGQVKPKRPRIFKLRWKVHLAILIHPHTYNVEDSYSAAAAAAGVFLWPLPVSRSELIKDPHSSFTSTYLIILK